MGLLDFLKMPRSDHPDRKAALQGRSQIYNMLDNIIGFDDDRVTPGEAFGAGLREDPVGLLSSGLQGATDDMRGLMYEGEAVQRPEDVLMMAAAPMAPNARGLLNYDPNVTNAIKAYHGSPHSFDKFSMDAIGTGEGAQAYGHGLYFAENEGVARSYRDALANRTYAPGNDASPLKTAWSLVGGDKSRVSMPTDELVPYVKSAWPDAPDAEIRDAIEEAKAMYRPGSMYEVNINANPEDLLDWDAPLSGQSEKVRSAWGKFLGTKQAARADESMGGALLGGRGQFENPTGRDFLGAYSEAAPHNRADPFDYQPKFSNALKRQGIPGIKYFDAGSRGTDAATRNFVVFDENLINIVKKYGIAGAAAMLGVSAMDVEQAMAQGAPQPQPQGLLGGAQ
tara:strand:+ start:81 stop:1265 length:1185 start_codon:yes stop_codon:yes gene_type:complete